MDAHECLNADTIIIDIREPVEYAKARIPGASFLPRGLLEFEIHGLIDKCNADPGIPNQDAEIVLYCGTGGRSALAAETLQHMGYRNVRSMSGGIVAWREARLPIET
jgi:rhodanese-related sulfurtransferase